MSIIILMGVCGSGKTTVAIQLAKQLSCPYRDADDFHSQNNKKKMARGIPLTDVDRLPWLLAIHEYIKSLLQTNNRGIVTCSALKRKYRNILVCGQEELSMECTNTQPMSSPVLFVYLKGTPELITARMCERKGHFMPPALIQSQFDILEEPNDPERHIKIDITCSVETIVSIIMQMLNSIS